MFDLLAWRESSRLRLAGHINLGAIVGKVTWRLAEPNDPIYTGRVRVNSVRKWSADPKNPEVTGDKEPAQVAPNATLKAPQEEH